jgi:hypothetical protein
MKKNNQFGIGLKLILAAAIISIIASAAFAVVNHPASEVVPGTFASGNYTFTDVLYSGEFKGNLNASYLQNSYWLTSEADPLFVAENLTLWAAVNAKLPADDQRYNETSWVQSQSYLQNGSAANFSSIITTGNVGIGTATPGQTLTVAGTANITSTLYSGNIVTGGNSIELSSYLTGDRVSFIDFHSDNTWTDHSLRIIRGSGANGATEINHRGTGIFQINTIEAAPIAFFTTNTERVRIDSSGKVGIGTTTAQGKLDVAGGISVGSYAGVNAPPSNGMMISGSVGIGSGATANKLEVAGSAAIGAGYPGTAAPSNGMIIQGNVGIGTTTPSANANLDVVGGIQGNSARLRGDQFGNVISIFVLDIASGTQTCTAKCATVTNGGCILAWVLNAPSACTTATSAWKQCLCAAPATI